jgi:predicted dehydrogenase
MLKVALIGCGRISFKHIEAYTKNMHRIRLVAACDPWTDRAKAAEYRKAIFSAEVTVYADYRAMLAKEKPDSCAVATESGHHPRIAIDCLEAGAYVICEKPMTLSTKDADAMNSAALRAGEKLEVCFQNGFNAPSPRQESRWRMADSGGCSTAWCRYAGSSARFCPWYRSAWL